MWCKNLSVSLVSVYNRWSYFFMSLSVSFEMTANVMKFMFVKINFGCVSTTGKTFASLKQIHMFVASNK
jgi:hypothetical protein